MTHRALKVSSLVLEQLDCAAMAGSVHSAFERTVNILFEQAAGGSGWVSLHTEDVPMHPYAVLLGRARRSANVITLLGARAGEAAQLEPSGITLGSGRVAVDLRGAGVWEARPAPAETDRMPARALRTDALAGLTGLPKATSPFLRAQGRPDGLEGMLASKCRAIREDLLAAWRREDMEGAAHAMMRAVGLGNGLTPSGDDFVVGFLGAAHFFAYGGGGAGEAARRMPIRKSMTTLPSFFMLRGALAGLLPEPLSSLLRSLAREDEGGVRRSARGLAALGASSGQDMLAGVICYLEATAAAGECK